MRPLFIARGPAFKKSYNHTKRFMNVDLYPLMLHILQLYPTKQFPNNGSLINVYDLLIPPIGFTDYDTTTQKWFNCKYSVFRCPAYRPVKRPPDLCPIDKCFALFVKQFLKT